MTIAELSISIKRIGQEVPERGGNTDVYTEFRVFTSATKYLNRNAPLYIPANAVV